MKIFTTCLPILIFHYKKINFKKRLNAFTECSIPYAEPRRADQDFLLDSAITGLRKHYIQVRKSPYVMFLLDSAITSFR